MKTWHLTGLLLALFPATVSALDSIGMEPDLLAPDEAFRFTAEVSDASTVRVTWDIADGYYMYRDRIKFNTGTNSIELGEIRLPEGKIKDDEFFGRIAVYRNRVTTDVPLKRAEYATGPLQLTAVSQGCADVGVCYPPHTQVAKLDLPPAGAIKTAGNPGPGALEKLGSSLGFDDTQEDFLEPDLAFQLSVEAEQPELLVARWAIAEGYYLYRDKVSITLVEGDGVVAGPLSLPAGETKHDEFFGDVQVFHHEAEARLPLQRASGAAGEISVQVGYQGCAEAGICYPPIKKTLPVALAAFLPGAAAASALTDTTKPAATAPASPAAMPGATSRQDDIARVLQESGLTWILLFFFGAGVLLAFTACMYPMIPILSSIIVGQGTNITASRGLFLSLIYVEAVAITYAVIGIISAQVGAGVQAFFQNPFVLVAFALIFVALAFSMFGFFHLQLPSSWQAKLSEISHRQQGGTLVGVAAMGVLSALIVGPCAGPVLIGALIYTSQSGDYLTGALAMFALGNGMGAPLLVIGASEGKLLPRAGGWMDTVKAVFGVVLLGVAILMMERVLPGPVTLMLWAAWLIIPAIYMGALDTLPVDASGWRRLWKGLGVVMLIYGIVLILGAATGARDPFNPLRNITAGAGTSGSGEHASQHLRFQRIKSVEDFNTALLDSTRQGKPVMLDFYADWCTYCIKMEDYTFSDRRVQQALAGTTLLQADVTANDATDLALLNHFKLFAPPAILFFDPDGQERRNHRLVGFLDADDFLAHAGRAMGGGT